MAMKNTIASIWRPVKGVFIKELGPNLFLFQFFHEVDISRVQSNGPWTFDNALLLTKRLSIGEQPSKIPLFFTDLWVQVYDLPFGFMTERVGKSIGNFIGTYLDSDEHSFKGVWQNYMRIRVVIDVRSPIKRRMKLTKPNGEWVWINFKYERLPTFYFFCGFLGHSEKFCEKLFNDPTGNEERAYGSWLRAPSRKNHNTIGSQWLRSSIPVKNSGGRQGVDDGCSSDNSSANHGPIFTEPELHVEGRQNSYETILVERQEFSEKSVATAKPLINLNILKPVSHSLEAGKGKEVDKWDNKRKRVEDTTNRNTEELDDGLVSSGSALAIEYERLPTFCFFCGFLGHSEKFCEKLFNDPTGNEERAYGSWLRAPSRKNHNTIGSQWLRSSIQVKNSGGRQGVDDGCSSDNSSANHGPIFTEPELHVEGRQNDYETILVERQEFSEKSVATAKPLINLNILKPVSHSLEAGKGKEVDKWDNKRKRVEDTTNRNLRGIG
ncbi:hypothetical protein DH2020_010258 [Rehmannia glutinosa]|uniref:Zinc knuckle CX2CX4HX4C domain-containing protein n=1 Tax=Rehmannia glutinosa TaxID=99300 RepID=A0ABR0XA80_REHGL